MVPCVCACVCVCNEGKRGVVNDGLLCGEPERKEKEDYEHRREESSVGLEELP